MSWRGRSGPVDPRWGPQRRELETLLSREHFLGASERAAIAPDASFDVITGVRHLDQYDRNVRAREAAWEVTCGAGRTLAAKAAENAAFIRTRNAACALAARDLVGRGEFTSEHYDVLTLPWRCAIGPIHPDDFDLGLMASAEREFAVRRWERIGLGRDAAIAAAALESVGTHPSSRWDVP